ncbi:MAG: zinc-ribbon domain-containing protein, partial [Spirochaetaceae bacterium]|nr:zinc-ribbon domain-containing protein [Spirochaetaceae bacterium]
MSCINCGKELAADAKFCMNCGTPVQPPSPVCAGCGAKLEAGWKACPECGAPVVCAGCGAELEAGWKACPECGAPVQGAGGKVAAAVGTPANWAAPVSSEVEAHIARAKEYAKKRDYDKAIAEYTKAIELDPDNVAAYVRRGEAYYCRDDDGDDNRAIADYTRAIKLDPDNA